MMATIWHKYIYIYSKFISCSHVVLYLIPIYLYNIHDKRVKYHLRHVAVAMYITMN